MNYYIGFYVTAFYFYIVKRYTPAVFVNDNQVHKIEMHKKFEILQILFMMQITVGSYGLQC